MRVWRSLVMMALVAGASFTRAGARVAAQAAPAPPTPTFGIRAGLVGQTSLPGDHFTYGLAAGTGVDDFVVLYNYTDAPLTLSLYPADVHTVVGGGLAPGQPDDTASGIGAWVRIESRQVTVPPKGQIAPRFRLSVPGSTVPGDYVGAIVASLSAPRVPGQVSLETRAARLINLKVPGEVHLGVSVNRPRHSQHDETVDFEVLVRNTGNVLFTFTGAVLIDGGPARVVAPLQPTGIYVIPGGQAMVKAHWTGLPTIGRRAAQAELAVSVANRPAGVFRSQPLHLTFFPRVVAGVLGAILVTLIIVIILTRRRWRTLIRRRRQERAVLAEVRAQLRAGHVVTHGQQGPDAQRSADDPD